jgi:hypothetical protein
VSPRFWKYILVMAAFFGFVTATFVGLELFGGAQRHVDEIAHVKNATRSVDWTLHAMMHGALLAAELVFVALWIRGRKRGEPVVLRTALLAAPLVGYLAGLGLQYANR